MACAATQNEEEIIGKGIFDYIHYQLLKMTIIPIFYLWHPAQYFRHFVPN